MNHLKPFSLCATFLMLAACGGEPDPVSEVEGVSWSVSEPSEPAMLVAEVAPVPVQVTIVPVEDDEQTGPSSIAEQMLAATNAARAVQQDCGGTLIGPVPPLTLHDALNVAAQGHADDMAMNDALDFTWSDGTNVFKAASIAGYPYSSVQENFSGGQDDVAAFIGDNVNFAYTCEILMNPEATHMGGGMAVSEESGTPYWSQVIGFPDAP